jgi:hypothetical protein
MPDRPLPGEQWDDRTISMVMANVLGFALTVPLIALAIVPYGLLHGWVAAVQGLARLRDHLLLAVVVFVVSVVAHEGLHAAGWLLFGRVPRSAVKFGIRHATPYAHTRAAVEAGPYRIGIALPGLLLGILPVALSWLTGSSVLMLYGALMLSAAAGDILILWLLRDVRVRQLVQDHPTKAGCQVLQPS